ncbi:restless-like transposase [Pochonia chlamydosporia 170]|uniref:Restless-like transposase n=1 Tax=Pochonia chlamydosporia 170 TaxID=1380566 RepID=A0A179EY49_METCM|nr:restless-like transposase [Pochonia chlamydosporia 170]XP_018136374.1 restless-like transposase [Pochonia chlamydosporia 170]OAQ57829.2 restless-like transposase [Pochonia chlamydosporia 170]OAQ58168.1 restless-like transposase [Pochonia chlamydosporia 170]
MHRFSQVNRSNTGTMAANVALFARSADDDYLAVPEKPVEDADTTAESSQFSESSSPLARRKRVRTPTALNIWAESRQPNRHEPERNKHGQKIWYCKRCSYSQAAHNRVRGHLRDKHCVLIFEHQSAKKLGQGVAIDRLFRQQAARQNGQDVERERYLRASVDEVAYNQALVNLITAHSLPHSLVEWPEWYALLHTVNHMAPRVVTHSRGQVPKLLEASFATHRENLISRLIASPTQIHFSIDIWSSPNHHSFLAIVAHYIDLASRQLRKALLALRELEGSHTGEAIAETFLQVVDSYGVRAKMGYFTLLNAYNNDTMMHTVAETCGFNSTHRRLRCNGHIINLAVQAFLFGKNKEASDEALRQVSRLSRREQEGAVGRAETATAWRQYGALGMLHNLVVWIRSSTQRYQAFLQAAGPIALRKELNSFMDDRYSESDIRFDYLHPEHWQELQEIHDFLQPFYEITKDTQWDKTSLDEVICSMDFLVTHYKAAMEQFQHNTTMVDRIMTSWYKFDDYYTRTDDTPVYAAAILLHPSLREAHLKEAWKDQPQYIGPAIAAVRKLWDDFKPQQEPEIEEDLSAYEAYKKRIYQKSSCHDEFSRFIEGPTLPIGDSSALSWWLEPTQQTSYPSLYHLAINIFSIPAMSAEAERVFSGARRTVSWDRGRLSAQIVEYTECLKHWIKSGLLDQPYMIPEPMDAELDSRDIEMLSEGIEPRVVPLE